MRTRCHASRFEVLLIIVVLLFSVHLPLVLAESSNPIERGESPFPDLPDWLEFGGQLEVEVTREQNFDLESTPNDRRHLMRPELQLETHIQAGEHIEGLLLLELSHEFSIQDDTDRDEPDHVAFLVKEVYVTVDKLFGAPLSIQIGRQAYEDERQWLYDDELDAIRLRYRIAKFRLEATLARVALVDEDFIHGEGREETDFYHLYGQYEVSDFLTLAAYSLVQDDNMSMGERPVFFGLRASGEFEPEGGDRPGFLDWPGLQYWIDAAHVRGKSDGRRVRGWGLDVGLISTFGVVGRPSLILAYAFGSGDDTSEEGTDTAFRQSGLQGNGAELGSVTDIQYYGELLDPELSNLHIFTVGLGLRPVEEVSLTALYHTYRQDRRSDEFREVAIEAEPTGLSRDIGSEFDLVGGWASGEVELELALGVLFPGRAFPSETDNAFFAQFTFTVMF